MTDLIPVADLPLATERLILRAFEPDDWRGLLAFESDPATARYLLHRPMGETEAKAYVERAIGSRDEQPRKVHEFALVLREDRTLAGRCGLQISDPEAGGAAIWYVLDGRLRGRGLMLEAVRALLAFGFEVLGLPRMWADIDPRNTASVALCERLGLRREAHFVENVVVKGELCSTLIYAMLRREWIERGGLPIGDPQPHVEGIMAKPRTPLSKAELDKRLDQELEDSFPASDPPTLTEPEGDVRDSDDESED